MIKKHFNLSDEVYRDIKIFGAIALIIIIAGISVRLIAEFHLWKNTERDSTMNRKRFDHESSGDERASRTKK
jgi:hypothetical protein